MARAKKTVEDVQFCCRVTHAMHDKIAIAARALSVSMGVLISNAIEEYFIEHEEELRQRGIDITLLGKKTLEIVSENAKSA